MKKLLTLTLALCALSLFISCGKDDAPFGENELVIDGEVIPLVASWYYDQDMDLTNGLTRAEGATITTHVRRYKAYQDASLDSDASIYVSFYSKGDSFKNGTYAVKAYDDEVDADTESFAVINGSTNSEVYGFFGFGGVSGKITISSDLEDISPNNMTMKFNLAGVAEVPSTGAVNVDISGQFKGAIIHE